MKLNPGDFVLIHAYKHNSKLYRAWKKAVVYEAGDERLILINEDVIVTELNGRRWKTNEPAIWFFFPNKWFNIICMFKKKGINYYCNMASPYIYEEGAIKYIDYDLDIKVFNDWSYKILDLREFNRNRVAYNYPREVVEKVWQAMDELQEKIQKQSDEFNHEFAKKLWEDYKKRR